jgi:hypothetical protein
MFSNSRSVCRHQSAYIPRRFKVVGIRVSRDDAVLTVNIYRRFGGSCCSHLQAVSRNFSSETSVTVCHSTRAYVPENLNYPCTPAVHNQFPISLDAVILRVVETSYSLL